MGLTMEEKIRKAMAELGITQNVDKVSSKNLKESNSSKVMKDVEESASDFVNDAISSVDNTKDVASDEETCENDGVETYESENEETEVEADEPELVQTDSAVTNNSLYVKFKGGKIVILIPSELELKEEVIGGNRYKSAVVELPDFNSSLMELKCVNVVEDNTISKKVDKPQKKKDSKKPQIVKKSNKKPILEDIGENSSKEELLDRKAELTKQIAEARKNGDTELVNELRRQRRKIRNELNQG